MCGSIAAPILLLAQILLCCLVHQNAQVLWSNLLSFRLVYVSLLCLLQHIFAEVSASAVLEQWQTLGYTEWQTLGLWCGQG